MFNRIFYKKHLVAMMSISSFLLIGCDSTEETKTQANLQHPIQKKLQTPTTLHGKEIKKLSKFIREDRVLSSDKYWLLDGLVVVRKGVTLKIEKGTTVAGMDGVGRDTSYLIVENGAKIIAKGTQSQPIVFTSQKALFGEDAAPGQWGGLTILGDAGNPQVDAYEAHNAFFAGDKNPQDSSGVLQHIKILNSGIAMEKDKEINGLSLLGVGSGTRISNITVDRSGDDGIEIWGGTVNLSNITITRCEDDYFDIDDGYSGTVKNMNIVTTTGNAAIEMSGETYAYFNGFKIVQNGSNKEGGIYFKKDGIGGHFSNGLVVDNVEDKFGSIHSSSADKISDKINKKKTSFVNVVLDGKSKGEKITGTSSKTLKKLLKS